MNIEHLVFISDIRTHTKTSRIFHNGAKALRQSRNYFFTILQAISCNIPSIFRLWNREIRWFYELIFDLKNTFAPLWVASSFTSHNSPLSSIKIFFQPHCCLYQVTKTDSNRPSISLLHLYSVQCTSYHKYWTSIIPNTPNLDFLLISSQWTLPSLSDSRYQFDKM